MDQALTDKTVVGGSGSISAGCAFGIAIHKGDPVPDISTVDKLAAYLKSADSVMYSDPKSGSMEARIIDGMLTDHPEFAGDEAQDQHRRRGRSGGLARGEGQMALQLICEIVNHPDS